MKMKHWYTMTEKRYTIIFKKKTTVTNQDSAKSTTINLIKDFKDLNEDD